MVTFEDSNNRREELEGRLSELETQKTSLEKEIDILVEQIPVLDLERQAALLESHTGALREVRNMLQALAQGSGKYTSETVRATAEPVSVALPTN